jgi:hypothetical protein
MCELRDIDRPRTFPRRRTTAKGPILTAVLAVAIVGALMAFVFLETKDGRLASPASGIGNPQTTPSHG